MDIIGDVHGQLHALQSLGKKLGYDVDSEDWGHPDGRRLVFLGDLVDRGAHSLEVATLVRDLCERDRAVCLMGNHEYNLVARQAKVARYDQPKESNKATIEDIERRPNKWNPILAFFRDLPIALEFEDLRIIHACWHLPSFRAVQEHLGRRGDANHWASKHVALRSPFNAEGLDPALPLATGDVKEAPHEILMKGYEELAATPFRDSDGKRRTHERVAWWQRPEAPVRQDRTLVVGHYWNLPPMDGSFCPPHPSGTPALRAWQDSNADKVPASGEAACPTDVICVDFNGVTLASERACVGALRWPERQVAWATSRRTRAPGDG